MARKFRNISLFQIGIIVSALLVTGCQVGRQPGALVEATPTEGEAIGSEQDRIIKVGASEAVIFSAATAQQQRMGDITENGVQEYWTPAEDQVNMLEEKLPEFLKQNQALFYQTPPVWENLEKYTRQYIGYQLDGQKIILMNAFCDANKQDWQHKLVWVMDGGECYFQAVFDVDQRMFIRLSVNGEA